MPVDFGIRCEFRGNTRVYDFVLALIGGGRVERVDFAGNGRLFFKRVACLGRAFFHPVCGLRFWHGGHAIEKSARKEDVASPL